MKRNIYRLSYRCNIAEYSIKKTDKKNKELSLMIYYQTLWADVSTVNTFLDIYEILLCELDTSNHYFHALHCAYACWFKCTVKDPHILSCSVCYEYSCYWHLSKWNSHHIVNNAGHASSNMLYTSSNRVENWVLEKSMSLHTNTYQVDPKALKVASLCRMIKDWGISGNLKTRLWVEAFKLNLKLKL